MGCVHPSGVKEGTSSPETPRGSKKARSKYPGTLKVERVEASNNEPPSNNKASTVQVTMSGEEEAEPDVGPLPDVTEAVPLQTGSHTPELSEPSTLLDERQCNALAQAVPIRHRWRRWILAYSTNRDGISLQTLYRNTARSGPTITVIRDRDGYLFGCFCSEGWKIAPRYYGSGECFVFQLKPEMALWRWYQKKMALSRNDYFQFSTSDCLAIGGAPAYALKLDGDLTFGRSGISETFGNISLAGAEEFQIGRVEVWSLN